MINKTTYTGSGDTRRYYFKGGMVWLDKPLAQGKILTITTEPKKMTVEIEKEVETMSNTEKRKLIDVIKNLLALTSVDQLWLPIRAVNILKAAHIKTFYDLTQTNEDELRKIEGCGRVTLNDIKCEMERFGLKFGMKWPEPDWQMFANMENMFGKLDELND